MMAFEKQVPHSSETAQIHEEEVLRLFQFEKILNEDTRQKTLNLLGKVDSQYAIIVAEKTAFDTDPDFLSSLRGLRLLGKNDIYHWFLGSQNSSHPDVKFTFIYPATETHIRKYTRQNLRIIIETPEMYKDHVEDYVESKRINGQLKWVYNVLEHINEEHRIVYEDSDDEMGFILLPDLKWDQITMSALYMMAIVRRRDITSIRDLKKKDVPWLKSMKAKITNAIVHKYPHIEEDQLKLYVHYHPSYYHFHIHAVVLSHDGGLGQAAGKALLLGNVINMLELMAGDENVGLEKATFDILIGEESELWQNVYVKLKGV